MTGTTTLLIGANNKVRIEGAFTDPPTEVGLSADADYSVLRVLSG